jgi:hypothetical protein
VLVSVRLAARCVPAKSNVRNVISKNDHAWMDAAMSRANEYPDEPYAGIGGALKRLIQAGAARAMTWRIWFAACRRSFSSIYVISWKIRVSRSRSLPNWGGHLWRQTRNLSLQARQLWSCMNLFWKWSQLAERCARVLRLDMAVDTDANMANALRALLSVAGHFYGRPCEDRVRH